MVLRIGQPENHRTVQKKIPGPDSHMDYVYGISMEELALAQVW